MSGPENSDDTFEDVTDFKEHCDHVGSSHEDVEASDVIHYGKGRAKACEKTLKALTAKVKAIDVTPAAAAESAVLLLSPPPESAVMSESTAVAGSAGESAALSEQDALVEPATPAKLAAV